MLGCVGRVSRIKERSTLQVKMHKSVPTGERSQSHQDRRGALSQIGREALATRDEKGWRTMPPTP